MDDDMKLCLICGVNTNKKARHERYNLPPEMIKKKTVKYNEDSESDSDEGLSRKSKKKAPPKVTRAPPAPVATASRQTRNRNPKTFASSLCKVMELPETPEHPFVQIFSNADYCPDCMVKVKDVHSYQMELEKIQANLNEARVDFEIDLSKHLQKIPFCKNVLRNPQYERYKEDITAILDFHGTDDEKKEKNNKRSLGGDDDGRRRSKRQKADDENPKYQEIDENVEDEKCDPDFEPNGKNAEVPLDGEGEGDAKDATSEVAVVAESEVKAEVKSEPAPEPVEIPKAVPVKVPVKKDPNLKCPNCPIPRYFNLLVNLEEHVERCHTDKRTHVCDICGRKLGSVKALQMHKSNVHDTGETVGWTCGFCDQNFSQKRYLEDHLDKHPQAKPLNCQFCGRGFPRKESLQKGFQIYKGEPVEPCKNCGRNLNLKDYLEHNRRVKEQ